MNKLKEMTMMLRQGEVLTLDDNKTSSSLSLLYLQNIVFV